MKIQLISDLHLEFAEDIHITNAGADVLILAGDICNAEHMHRNPSAGIDYAYIQKGWYADDAIRYRNFFKQISDEFDTTLYVMGNHEHYGGRWNRTADILREECARHGNIHLLENDKMVINDTVFLGATLWSSFNNYDPMTEIVVKDMMNDYRSITYNVGDLYHKLPPSVTAETHRKTVEWITLQLELDKRNTVVVGHHAPSFKSIHPRYAHQTHMNGAFASDLDWLMVSHDHLKLWVHGHVHDSHDYMIGNTRIVCNPRGYPRERPQGAFDPNLLLDV